MAKFRSELCQVEQACYPRRRPSYPWPAQSESAGRPLIAGHLMAVGFLSLPLQPELELGLLRPFAVC